MSLSMKNNDYFEDYYDMFDYFRLIKKINPFYKLCFDKKNKNFVVINTDKNNEVCLRFDSFNFNIYKRLLESRVENSKAIFETIEQHNEKLEENRKKESSNMLKTRMEELVNYSKRTNKITQNDIEKIIEVKNA